MSLRPARLLRFVLPLLLATTATAQRTQLAPGPARPTGRILVSGFNSNAIHTYVAWNGAPRSVIAPVPGAQSIRQGPDGLLYACAEAIDEILRIDPETFELIDSFVHDDPLTAEDETGGLDGPTSAAFGPDGDLYVASFETDSILRYDGSTGAFIGVFVSTGLGGLNGPDAGTQFGPDGNLYVPSFWNDRVLRYDGETGDFLDPFIPFRSGNLRQPRDLAFHGDFVYVASSFNGRILRYDLDGNFINVFATAGQPYSLAFHPYTGNLYVVNLFNNNVRLHDGQTGAFLGTIIPTGSGGIAGAVYVTFVR